MISFFHDADSFMECGLNLLMSTFTRKMKAKTKYLDSSVDRWLQYLLSSRPVIDIAFEEMDMQKPPLFFSIQNSYSNNCF
jgi:hypothetical protein